jgi:hypothetical protein
MHGASCLLELKETNKYLYIGEVIFSFTTTEPILYFATNMGNNDVPDPVAYSKNNVYFMKEVQWTPYKNLPYENMWCYACALCTIKDPWHAFVIADLWYKRNLCPKGFLKKEP